MSRAYADLPLHYGQVPPWLYQRMSKLGVAIVEAIMLDYGRNAVLQRLSDPCWFQALGCVLGMDWHSSGITTSVMGALKRSVNERSKELGIYICGGKGKFSRETPNELLRIAETTGLNGDDLVRSSKLSAKVDNTAIQDGYQLYLHSFIVSSDGEWAVVQQGMNDSNGMARRYHWHSPTLKSFVEEPHTFIYGANQGQIINITDKLANTTRDGHIAVGKRRSVEVAAGDKEAGYAIAPRCEGEGHRPEAARQCAGRCIRKRAPSMLNHCYCSKALAHAHCNRLY